MKKLIIFVISIIYLTCSGCGYSAVMLGDQHGTFLRNALLKARQDRAYDDADENVAKEGGFTGGVLE